ncbi:MAG: hypothetical protein ABIH80_06010, partial [Methanobacteriota archaeon]
MLFRNIFLHDIPSILKRFEVDTLDCNREIYILHSTIIESMNKEILVEWNPHWKGEAGSKLIERELVKD